MRLCFDVYTQPNSHWQDQSLDHSVACYCPFPLLPSSSAIGWNTHPFPPRCQEAQGWCRSHSCTPVLAWLRWSLVAQVRVSVIKWIWITLRPFCIKWLNLHVYICMQNAYIRLPCIYVYTCKLVIHKWYAYIIVCTGIMSTSASWMQSERDECTFLPLPLLRAVLPCPGMKATSTVRH